MALTPPVRLAVDDVSGVAPVRRVAENMALRLGLDAVVSGRAAIVASELATNLIRHAQGGEIVIRAGAGPTLDVIAWDRGPGIRDVHRASADGFSTASGSGTGLGAIVRQSRSTDLHTVPGRGTVVAARLGAEDLPDEIDGLVLAVAGEQVSGDAWAHAGAGDVVTVMMADGLGHGPSAAEASAAALAQLDAETAPEELLRRAHGALRATRGAAVAVARLDRSTGQLRFAGVGNIAARVVAGDHTHTLTSTNGTIGHRLTRVREYEEAMPPGSLLVLHSDGCRDAWRLADYAGLARRVPLVVAATLIRDFERGRDDVSVAVMKTRDAR